MSRDLVTNLIKIQLFSTTEISDWKNNWGGPWITLRRNFQPFYLFYLADPIEE